jgi:hypothetical protein
VCDACQIVADAFNEALRLQAVPRQVTMTVHADRGDDD